jgi:cytochrome c oxidase assembly protein subunit 11
VTGINILSLSERQVPGNGKLPASDVRSCLRTRQVDKSAAPSRWSSTPTRAGLGDFKSCTSALLKVHPGEFTTVMYEFQNVQNRRMAAQAIPSYAPRQAAALSSPSWSAFCFNQYTLEPGEKKRMARGVRD